MKTDWESEIRKESWKIRDRVNHYCSVFESLKKKQKYEQDYEEFLNLQKKQQLA